MQLKVGTYTHAVAESSITFSEEVLWSENNKRIGRRERWNIEGFLQAASQSALDTAIGTLKTQYRKDNETAVLLFDDGSETQHKMDTTASLSGVRVRFFEFPFRNGAEYSTFRSYRITVEGEFTDNINAGIIYLQDTLTFNGGGPRFVHKQTLAGLPQKQIVAQSTPHRVVQSGVALGHLGYITAPSPLFPDDFKQDESSVKRVGPDNVYALTNKATHYRTEWNYLFESVSPMNGNPIT